MWINGVQTRELWSNCGQIKLFGEVDGGQIVDKLYLSSDKSD